MILRQRIATERAANTALDSKLDYRRMPFTKEQLGIAKHRLDDAVYFIRLADRAQPRHAIDYIAGAEMFLTWAIRVRKSAQQTVDAHGGLENAVEV
jgi:hypothetical protein